MKLWLIVLKILKKAISGFLGSKLNYGKENQIVFTYISKAYEVVANSVESLKKSYIRLSGIQVKLRQRKSHLYL